MVTSPGISIKHFYQAFLPIISTLNHIAQANLPDFCTATQGGSAPQHAATAVTAKTTADSSARTGSFVTSRAVSSNAFFSAWR
jgi:hypothetical protein